MSPIEELILTLAIEKIAMTQKLPITVTMIASNEEDRIAAALDSVVNWVQDIVVIIDTKSSDKTFQIAEEKGARAIINPWPGYGPQKRFAEDNAHFDWILNLDADERISSTLAQEIQQLFATGTPLADGYYIPTHDVMLGTQKISPYVVYNRIRLYNKRKGRFSQSNVHDNVVMQSNSITKQLKNIMTQDSIRSFHHWLDKMNSYTDAQVIDLTSKQRKLSKLRMTLEFWINFLKAYFLKGFWRTGMIGYIYAMNFAYGRFLRQIKWYEKTVLKK